MLSLNKIQVRLSGFIFPLSGNSGDLSRKAGDVFLSSATINLIREGLSWIKPAIFIYLF